MPLSSLENGLPKMVKCRVGAGTGADIFDLPSS